jgi:arylformamidase
MPMLERSAIHVEEGSDLPDPCEALVEALDRVGRALAAQGAGPQHMTAMTWHAPAPEAIHPARTAVERVYREVFGGFRPPIDLRRSAGGGVRIEARATTPTAPGTEPLWHDLAAPALARAYSARSQVASMRDEFQRWTRDGAAVRASFPGLDIAYGPGRLETLDFHRPAGSGRPPLWIFIHGGYWQASDKDQHTQFCTGMLAAGFAVANLNYGLAPETTVEDAVTQVRAAIRFLAAAADDLGFDGKAMHVAGHSAGGHLAAMAAADPHGPRLRSALLLSGLFDMRPLAMLPFGSLLGLTSDDMVARTSPTNLPAPPGVRLGFALGGLESDEFKWQSADLAQKWGAEAPLILDGTNHFSLLDGLTGGALLQYALNTTGV